MADTATTFAGIHNENEFYSHHYLSEIFTGDIRDTVARWRDVAEAAGGASAGARTPHDALRALARDYLQRPRRCSGRAGATSSPAASSASRIHRAGSSCSPPVR